MCRIYTSCVTVHLNTALPVQQTRENIWRWNKRKKYITNTENICSSAVQQINNLMKSTQTTQTMQCAGMCLPPVHKKASLMQSPNTVTQTVTKYSQCFKQLSNKNACTDWLIAMCYTCVVQQQYCSYRKHVILIKKKTLILVTLPLMWQCC